MTQTAATTRPILFTADMVRAILEGRKTQTRRIIKDLENEPNEWKSVHQDGGGNWIAWSDNGPDLPEFTKKAYPNGEGYKCPYGYPGDHLYVRETWAKQLDGKYTYRADTEDWELADYTATGNWRPSIHMPRAAARIHLHITDIRAQRLHDITETDAIAEGIHYTTPNSGPNRYYDNYHTGRWMEPEMLNNPIASYRTLWEKINGPGSWLENPWVWVITFKKV